MRTFSSHRFIEVTPGLSWQVPPEVYEEEQNMAKFVYPEFSSEDAKLCADAMLGTVPPAGKNELIRAGTGLMAYAASQVFPVGVMPPAPPVPSPQPPKWGGSGEILSRPIAAQMLRDHCDGKSLGFTLPWDKIIGILIVVLQEIMASA